MLITLILKEFKLLFRDLHGLAVLFAMPILFMLIMSAALSHDDELNHQESIVVAGLDADTLTSNFVRSLQKENLNIRLGSAKKMTDFQAALQRGEIDILILNPNNAETIIEQEKPLQMWLNPNVDRAWLAGLKGIMQKRYTEQRLAVFLADSHIKLQNNQREPFKTIEKNVNQDLDKKFSQINHYLQRELWQEIYLNRQGDKVQKPNSVQHSVPAWLIFGMFFIMIPLSNVMAVERQTNTLTRLRIACAPAWKLIVAKLIPYFVINQLQFAGMIALGIWVLPLFEMPAFSLSGSFYAYPVLAATVSLAALGYGLLVSIIARTTEHAVVLGGGGIIIMAALGGIMVPVYIMPPIMQNISQFSPMGWALSAFQNLLLNHYTVAQIFPLLVRLSLFGILALLLAAILYSRQLKTQAKF